MPRPLRLLLVEDSPDDAELVARALRRGGFEPTWERVATAEATRAALVEPGWDLVIADYTMPGFDGLAALQLLLDTGRDIPFILVSGNIGEEVAVRAMKAGAHDYVLKQNLGRLGTAVERELREAEVRARRRAAEQALRDSERRQRFLADVGAALGRSLDADAVLREVVRLAVPELARGCAAFLYERDGRLRQVAFQHGPQGSEPPWRALVDWCIEQLPASAAAEGEGEGESEGEPFLLGLDGTADGRAGAPAAARAAQELGLADSLLAPLRARGRNVGVLLLLSGGPGRRFGPGELAMVGELARRTATAIENAQLFRSAQEAIEVRDEFLSIASHELKTPLSVLQLDLQGLDAMLAQRPDTARPALLQSRVRRALRQTERLGKLVGDLLDVSRITTGRLELRRETVDLAVVARDVAERLSGMAERAGSRIAVRAAAPAVGSWDRDRIEQVLASLISNAVKYGAGRPVEVYVEPDPSSVRVSVVDHGIGIAPGDVERIFGRFERAVSVRHYGGLGLGLFIARQIAEAHGGEIHVRSTPGEGSKFTLELPWGPVEGRPQAAPATQPSGAAPEP